MQGKRLVKHSSASLRQQIKNNFYLGVYQLICFSSFVAFEFLNPASIYLLKVNHRYTRKMCEMYSKLTIETLK